MRIAPLTSYETLRLEDLYAYEIVDTEAEQEYNDLVELAAQIVGCPIAAISFIDERRQWFKATKGVDVKSTTRDTAFCTHAILQDEPFIVNDTTKDERFYNNPLVSGEPHVRFYAGAPIRSAAGHNIGSLCVIDQKPNSLSVEKQNALEAISRQISKLLELRLKNKMITQQATAAIDHQRKHLQTTISHQEKESLDYSRELHENIAQGLAATKFYLDIAEETASIDMIIKAKDNLNRMIADTRNLSKKMYPSTLRNIGYVDLACDYITNYSLQTGIETSFSHNGADDINHDLSMTLFRITQEQLKNISKHAKASKAVVEITAGRGITLSIKDNGVGFDMSSFQRNFGINKIVSFAEFYGGTVDINGAVNKGCKMEISIPMPC